MNNVNTLIAVTCMALLPILPCHGQTADEASAGPFFVGAGIGGARVSEDARLIDGASTAYRLFGGYTFNETLSLEASFLKLDDAYEYFPLTSPTQRAVADGISLNTSVVVAFPVSKRARFDGRVGLAYWSIGDTALDIGDSGTSVAVGIGFGFRLSGELSLRANYDLVEMGGLDTYIGTISLSYGF